MINLEHTEYGDGVHKSSVELKVRVVWADVIRCGHQALHYQSKPHGVEEPGVVGYSIFPVNARILSRQLMIHELSPPYEDHEETAQHHVADVGEDMVKVRQEAEGVGTQKIVITQIFVSSLVKNLLISDD